MKANSLLGYMSVALAASGLTMAAQGLFRRGEQPKQIQKGVLSDQSPWQKVLASLERIEESLGNQQLASPASAAAPERTNIAGDFHTPEVSTKALLEVLERMEALERRLPNSAAPTDHIALKLQHPPNLAALNALGQDLEVDRENAIRGAYLLTTNEVIRKFGYPSFTYISDEGYDYYWTYRQSAGSNTTKEIRFYFISHRVVRVGGEWKP